MEDVTDGIEERARAGIIAWMMIILFFALFFLGVFALIIIYWPF